MMGVFHVVVAMKPLDGNFAENALKHGVVGLNIDGCRIVGPAWKWGTQTDIKGGGYGSRRPSDGSVLARDVEGHPGGRWPSNVILGHKTTCLRAGVKTIENWECGNDCPVALLDRQSGMRKSGDGNTRRKKHTSLAMAGSLGGPRGFEEISYGDSGGASRFFKRVTEFKEEGV